MTGNRLSDDRRFRQAFSSALMWVIGCWASAVVLMLALVSWFRPMMLLDSVLIAVASVVIAAGSMLPGLLGGADRGRVVGSMMIGVLIRLAGTVALFLTCRYHMASPAEMVAAMTISWYVLLTLIEIVVLVRQSPGVTKTSCGPYANNTAPQVG